MSRKTTRFGCLGLLLLVVLDFAWLSWAEGPVERWSIPLLIVLVGLPTIYVNDIFEAYRERRRKSRGEPPENDA